MAEDMLREPGYILPQSVDVRKLLELMLENAADDFPKDTVKMLLKQLL
jgi:hypothetical protein